MRAAIASWTRWAAPPKTFPVPPSNDPRLWQPQHGIVFNGSSVSRNMSSLHNAEVATPEFNEQEVLSFNNVRNESYILRTPIDAGAKAVNPKDKPTISAGGKDGVAEGETADKDQDELSDDMPLTFKMSSKLYEAAKNAEPGSPESFWSHKLYRRPPKPGSARTDEERVVVHYCKTKETSERVAKYFTEDKVIGFDIEWSVPLKPGPKNNVSLIQLANDERVALFHIALFPKNEVEDLVAPTLKQVMEDPNITKVGVAIKGDCTRLRKHLQIDSRGMFELSHLYKLVCFSKSGETSKINKKLVSLQTQVEEHLELPMFKGQEVRSSDWSKGLKMDQIMYAASDSYAGLRLYEILEEQRKQLDPTPPRPHHAELNLPIRLASGVMIDTVEEQIEPEESESNSNENQDSITPENTAPKTPRARRARRTTTPTTTVSQTTATTITTATTPSTTTPSKPKEKAPIPPQAQTAARWVTKWKSTLPKNHIIRASDRQLQTYSLWHVQGFNATEVAALMRDPPLAESTVMNYIMQAVNLECLDFDRERMRVIAIALGDVAASRFKRVVGQLGL